MLLTKQKCPECGDSNFFHNRERGEIVCRSCSVVLDDAVVDFGRDSASFDEDSNPTGGRTGAPFDPRVANNLITTVGTREDIARLPRHQQLLMRRIRKKNNWTSASIEQNLGNALTHLGLISNSLGLPIRVEKEAASLYRMAAERNFTIARAMENVIAAAIYLSCRLDGSPKTLKEIANIAKVDKKILGKTYKLMARRLNIQIKPMSPKDFTARFASQLGLDAKTESRALEIIDMALESDLTSGKSPISVAATTLYLSALMHKQRKTQKLVAETADITEATLRARAQELIKELKLKIRIKDN
ncbi:hypothetical protein J4457_02000 [Candidatus Woesearchaeota archaeon]|nr:hypothetical protein [Candidatus Woesearchaeota archaeon]